MLLIDFSRVQKSNTDNYRSSSRQTFYLLSGVRVVRGRQWTHAAGRINFQCKLPICPPSRCLVVAPWPNPSPEALLVQPGAEVTGACVVSDAPGSLQRTLWGGMRGCCHEPHMKVLWIPSDRPRGRGREASAKRRGWEQPCDRSDAKLTRN